MLVVIIFLLPSPPSFYPKRYSYCDLKKCSDLSGCHFLAHFYNKIEEIYLVLTEWLTFLISSACFYWDIFKIEEVTSVPLAHCSWSICGQAILPLRAIYILYV